MLGDGLFNLYYVGSTEPQPTGSREVLTFSFISHGAELAGLLMSVAAIAAALILIWLSPRTVDKELQARGIAVEQQPLSTAAKGLAVAGLVLLVIGAVVHAIIWSGGTSRIAPLNILVDPYSAEQLYIGAGMALLAVSIVLRLFSIDRQIDAGQE
jgi:hypothetical protein